MKYLKTFETLYRIPKVGDHIIGLVHNGPSPSDDIQKCGEITMINSEGGVKFVGYNGKEYFINIRRIQHWADTREEIEMFLQSNKYNL